MQVTKSIAYRLGDGRLSICHPVISLDDPAGFTEQDAIDRALSFNIPEGASDIRLVERATIPVDRSQREGWFAALV